VINQTRHQLIESLASISEMAPDMRFGQLMATLGFLVDDKSDHTIWEIGDVELLGVLEGHRAELASRVPNQVDTASATNR
jgi:hypothetical protein